MYLNWPFQRNQSLWAGRARNGAAGAAFSWSLPQARPAIRTFRSVDRSKFTKCKLKMTPDAFLSHGNDSDQPLLVQCRRRPALCLPGNVVLSALGLRELSPAPKQGTMARGVEALRKGQPFTLLTGDKPRFQWNFVCVDHSNVRRHLISDVPQSYKTRQEHEPYFHSDAKCIHSQLRFDYHCLICSSNLCRLKLQNQLDGVKSEECRLSHSG